MCVLSSHSVPFTDKINSVSFGKGKNVRQITTFSVKRPAKFCFPFPLSAVALVFTLCLFRDQGVLAINNKLLV